ncbi:hypothetical protein DFJ77DRAFT_450339, partial [Powellomyces hirtus]
MERRPSVRHVALAPSHEKSSNISGQSPTDPPPVSPLSPPSLSSTTTALRNASLYLLGSALFLLSSLASALCSSSSSGTTICTTHLTAHVTGLWVMNMANGVGCIFFSLPIAVEFGCAWEVVWRLYHEWPHEDAGGGVGGGVKRAVSGKSAIGGRNLPRSVVLYTSEMGGSKGKAPTAWDGLHAESVEDVLTSRSSLFTTTTATASTSSSAPPPPLSPAHLRTLASSTLFLFGIIMFDISALVSTCSASSSTILPNSPIEWTSLLGSFFFLLGVTAGTPPPRVVNVMRGVVAATYWLGSMLFAAGNAAVIVNAKKELGSAGGQGWEGCAVAMAFVVGSGLYTVGSARMVMEAVDARRRTVRFAKVDCV